MNIRPALAIILCGILVCTTQAMPIHYSQIGDAQVGQQSNRSSSAQTTSDKPETVNTRLTVESRDQPEFVRLSDGRLIPYGPGVICSDVCMESDVAENPPGLSKRWLIAIPIAGAAIVGLLLLPRDSTPTRTAVSDTSKEPTTPTSSPTPTPTPHTPGDQPQPVPEPTTIVLLGVGLAWLSRKRVLEVFKRSQK